jgi:hypothetical protein
MMKRTVCLLAVCFLLVLTASGEVRHCHVNNLPVTGLQEKQSPIAPVRLDFDSTGKISLGTLSLQNKTLKPITKLMLIVEFLTSEGLSVSMPFYTSETDNIPADLDRDWLDLHPNTRSPKMLDANHQQNFYGTSSTVPGECPSSAVINYVSLSFGDGSSFESGVKAWSAEPYLLDAEYFQIGSCRDELPSQFEITALIDRSGHARVQTNNQDLTDPAFHCLQAQLDHWVFSPEIRKGQPIDKSELRMFFTLHHRMSHMSEFTPIPHDVVRRFVRIDAFKPREGTNWFVQCGGFAAFTRTLKSN